MNESYQNGENPDKDPIRTKASEVINLLASEYGEAFWVPSGQPVDELVATILSQNTSDINTERAYTSLRQRFASWRDVRDAPVPEVADSIRAGGLADQKAPRIQRVLSEILSDSDSDQNQRFLHELRDLGLERALARLTALPGVGPKTAACVLLFAVGLPALPVDTHVFRVAKRLGLITAKVDANRAHENLRHLIPPEGAYQFHVHMIQHGRRVCRARNPLCERCILRDVCCYRMRLVESTEYTNPARVRERVPDER